MSMDAVDPLRSRMMSAIRARDTGPELILRRGLHAMGYRFRVAPKNLVGRPDVVLRKWSAVVFVHGCFWHAHDGCRYFRLPKTRAAFWREKLSSNTARDARTIARLEEEGWRVVVVWECAVRADADGVLRSVEAFLASDARYVELAGP